MILDALRSTSSLGLIATLFLGGLLARAHLQQICARPHAIPGPFLAPFTDFWRLYVVWGRRPELAHQKLLRKYGSLVRMGPKRVSIFDHNVIKTVYGLNAGFNKSDFYIVQQPITKAGTAVEGIFSTTDEPYHARLRKAVSSAYAMSTLLQFEPFVDSTTTVFLQALSDRFADRSGDAGKCDLGVWLQYYAVDVIGELTFSRRLGFVERGADLDNIIHDNDKMLDYFAVVGQMPILHRFLLKNPIRLWLSKMGLNDSSVPAVAFAKRCIDDRLHSQRDTSSTVPNETQKSQPKNRDFLSRFLEAGSKDPAFMTPDRILALTSANMFAGSDTTAITLRAVFDNILRNSDIMSRLLWELDAEEAMGHFTRRDGLVQWTEVRDLPYLNAIIKEALRFHPAAGLPLERIVPLPRMTVQGQYLPAGTIVGCSAWTLHQSEAIFGALPDRYLPERWINASKEKLAEMNNCLFSFGAGARTCIGRNISMLEMYRLVPAILRRFQLELVHPEQPLRLHNSWFVKQSGMYVRLQTMRSRGLRV
ncbi:hypothetical protein FE257_006744 [Aspergillus nanangensis]|uniref:Cytochrome P450 n=1 Tax=Aspergillus nanangensis TaxID=2582783 RepID=A0AAD4CP10_ASPNN|nr:hypothetical protein FE257_006744 [Aspergillus nanangensis]